VTTYNADGTPSTPTITTGVSAPFGVAVDADGKIYVANNNNNTVTTYNADGSASTPTITGLNGPFGIAVH
jgi:YVTN family beta-propeller protein